MAHLQIERTIAELRASLHAASAADAFGLVDHILKIRVLNKASFKRPNGTYLVLGPLGQGIGLRFKKAGAQFAIAAHLEFVKALHGGLVKNAMRRALATLGAFIWVDLPHSAAAHISRDQATAQAAEKKQSPGTAAD